MKRCALLLALVAALFTTTSGALAQRVLAQVVSPRADSIPFTRPADLPGNVSLPENLTAIFPPGPDVPPDLARFYGVWTGLWGQADSISVIHRMTAKSAVVIYCWGAVPGAYILTAGCTEGRLDSKDGELKADGRRTVRYRLRPDGGLEGEATGVSRQAGNHQSEANNLRRVYP